MRHRRSGWKSALLVLLVLLVLLAGLCGAGARLAAAGTATAPPESPAARRDSRLAQVIALRADAIPLREAVQRLSAATGVQLSTSGSAGDEPLVAFVPGCPLEAVMSNLAELFRLQWARSGKAEKSAYRLERSGAASRQENAARQEELRAVLGFLAQPAPGAGAAGAERTAEAGVIHRRAEALLRDGYLTIRVGSLPTEERNELEAALQPGLDRAYQSALQAHQRQLEEYRTKGMDAPAGQLPDPPRTNPDDVILESELTVEDGPGVRVSLRYPTGSSGGLPLASTPNDFSVERAFYAGYALRPAEGALPESVVAGDPFAKPAGLPDRVNPRSNESWPALLEHLSDSTGIAVYADGYVVPGPRGNARLFAARGLEERMSGAAVLDQLCRQAPGRPNSFWWRRGGAALLRDSHWLWRSAATLPADLQGHLSELARRHGPPPPEVLQPLAELSLFQVQGLFATPGSLDVWDLCVRIPARLGPEATAAVLGQGLQVDHLPAAELARLAALLQTAGIDPSKFSARVRAAWQTMPMPPYPALNLNLEARVGEQRRTGNAWIPLPESEAGHLAVLVTKPN